MASDIASIGIAIDTAGLEKGAVALDALASKGADVDRAMSQVEGATARAKKSLDTLGQGAKSASGMGELSKDAADAAVAIKGMGDASDKASGGLKSWASNMLGMGNAAKQAAAEQERLIGMMRDVYTSGTAQEQGYIKALADRVNQMRLSGAEQEKYIARSKGMSDATQELAGALRTQLDAAKNNERGFLGLGGHIEALAKKAAVAAAASWPDFPSSSLSPPVSGGGRAAQPAGATGAPSALLYTDRGRSMLDSTDASTHAGMAASTTL